MVPNRRTIIESSGEDEGSGVDGAEYLGDPGGEHS
jgi:hypothetical protein